MFDFNISIAPIAAHLGRIKRHAHFEATIIHAMPIEQSRDARYPAQLQHVYLM